MTAMDVFKCFRLGGLGVPKLKVWDCRIEGGP